MENRKVKLKIFIATIVIFIVVVSCTVARIYIYNTNKLEMNTLPQLRAKGVVTGIDELNKSIAVSSDNVALILDLPNTEYCVYPLDQIKIGDQISYVYFPSDINYSKNSVVIMSYKIVDGSSIK